MSSKYNFHYQKIITSTVKKSLANHNRILALRIDLRFPMTDINYKNDSFVITRFFESLKEKIKFDVIRKEKRWNRKLTCKVHYVWAREFGKDNNKKHYHILLLLNKDIYHFAGNYNQDEGCLSAMIKQAWCSAIQLPYLEYNALVHFPKDSRFYLDKASSEIEHQIYLLECRANYLAKNYSKNYGDGERSFGSSQ